MKQSFSSLEKSLEESLAQSVASTSREKCHEKGCFYGTWPTQQGPPELSWLSLFPAASLPIIVFSFALSSLLNDIPVLSQQFQEQNLGETFCSLLVWGTHPLLCQHHLKMIQLSAAPGHGHNLKSLIVMINSSYCHRQHPQKQNLGQDSSSHDFFEGVLLRKCSKDVRVAGDGRERTEQGDSFRVSLTLSCLPLRKGDLSFAPISVSH